MLWRTIGQISNSSSSASLSNTPWYVYVIFGSMVSGLSTAVVTLWKALQAAHLKQESLLRDDQNLFGRHIGTTAAATAAAAEQARATDRLSDKIDHLVEVTVTRGRAS